MFPVGLGDASVDELDMQPHVIELSATMPPAAPNNFKNLLRLDLPPENGSPLIAIK
jgi:hypothetical protein